MIDKDGRYHSVHSLTVTLEIPAETWLAHYQGLAKEVVARAENGQVVRFPCNILQRFITRDGISGRFEIEFDAHRKFQSIRKITAC